MPHPLVRKAVASTTLARFSSLTAPSPLTPPTDPARKAGGLTQRMAARRPSSTAPSPATPQAARYPAAGLGVAESQAELLYKTAPSPQTKFSAFAVASNSVVVFMSLPQQTFMTR